MLPHPGNRQDHQSIEVIIELKNPEIRAGDHGVPVLPCEEWGLGFRRVLQGHECGKGRKVGGTVEKTATKKKMKNEGGEGSGRVELGGAMVRDS